MKYLRSNRGFTLVELAIVLVIIGIILGAVLKGQDLIQNARHKKFINDAGRKFEVATWTFFDRNGRFPGDPDKNGIINDGTGTPDVHQDLVTNSKLLSDTDNPVTLGSFSFYVGLGNDGGTPKKNVLVICPGTGGSCNGSITDDELEFFKAFDTSIDGTTDAGSGVVRGATSATFNSGTWIMTPTGIQNTSTDWSSAMKALVYYFDRKP
ncbi:prepilin-type N-terminal cleavage/methylation domain-containing protein [Thermodesulfovibrio sp. 3907-1M]|uniref:Prepilin-type N-terminal cleavage/methylation domain-containing protein n=1 Tax=Thermodesulfovibrio autotrophicus TaxID=3118333 RepID=A0AAU8GW53_9BACT